MPVPPPAASTVSSSDNIRFTLILGLALIDLLALYTLVIGFMKVKVG